MRIEKRGTFFCLLLIYILIPVLLSGQSFDGAVSKISAETRVIQTLNHDSIPFEKRSLLTGYGGFGSSILVRPERTGEERGAFVLAVPLTAEFAVNTALAMVERINHVEKINQVEKNNDRNYHANIIIAFLADESNVLPKELGGTAQKGLRDLLTLADMPENWILCYLDAAETPDEIVIRHGGHGYVAPLDLVKPLPSLFKSQGIPWSFNIRYNELYKLGFVEGPQPLLIAWEEEINGIVLSGKESKKHDSKAPVKPVDPENLAELLLKYTNYLDFPVLNTDRHYYFFQLPGEIIFFISEGVTAALFLVLSGLLLFYFLIYSARYNAILFFHIRNFFKSFWIFIIILVFLVISIKVSELLYSLLLRIFNPNVSAAFVTANYPGAGLTLLLALLIFLLLSQAIDLLRIPKKAQFYGVSAVIFITIGLYLAAFWNFSFVPILLWAFLFVFLGASLSNPFLVFLCVFFMPLFSIGALVNTIETGSTGIVEILISPKWNSPDNLWAAVRIAFMALPLFLLAKRGIILFHQSRGFKAVKEKNMIVFPVLISVVLVTMFAQILIMQKRVFPSGLHLIDGSDSTISMLDLSFKSLNFQDSKIINLHILASDNPVRFDVYLETDIGTNLLQVYSAPVPFEREDEGKQIKFSLGENPPNPLDLEIVVPSNFEGMLKVDAFYNNREPATVPEMPDSADYILKVSKTIRF